MPSKLGFGNTRKKAVKAEYGSSMYYKNPIMLTKAQETLPMPLQKEILAKEAEESNSPIAKKDFDFEKTMDLNVDRYGPSATQTNLDFTKKRDFSQEAIDERRKKKSMTKMYGKKGTMAYKYKSDAQRKAVHASKAERK